MPFCGFCNRNFVSSVALHAHCRDKSDHAYCVHCQTLFFRSCVLEEHIRTAHGSYSSPEPDSFDEETEVEEVESDDGSSIGPQTCGGCGQWFVDGTSLLIHLATSSLHNWCFVCSKDFSSKSALGKHNSSNVHSITSILCPLCKQGFRVPSAIAMHIESGGCHSQIDRHKVTAAVHSLEIIPTISIDHRIEGPPRVAPIVTYAATEQAFNGRAYECYLCHLTFRSLNALNQHLRSPAHDANEFRCPGRKCGRQFKLVSGLIQHIESEACRLAKFKEVEKYANDLTSRFLNMLKI